MDFDIKKHTQAGKLEEYSFLWSEIRLVVAAIALFLGGYPPLLYIFRIASLYGLLGLILKICWIISGLASGYLLYQWFKRDKKLFGVKDQLDTYAFLVSVVSGLNLGIAGLLGTNIGMAIYSNKFIFFVVGLIYLVVAFHLFRRWKMSNQKIF